MSNQKPDSFCKSFICIPRIYSNRNSEQIFREKGGKEETVIHGKSQRFFYKVSQFFSIRAINRVQSQALKSGIECEKKGIMNK